MTDAYEIEVQQRPRKDTAEVHVSCAWHEIAATLGRSYAEALAAIEAGGGRPEEAFARYEPRGDGVDIEAGFTSDRPVPAKGNVVPGELPGGDCAVCLHVGPYDAVNQAYQAIEKWLARAGWEAGGDPWEVYLSPPEEQPPRTQVILPLKPL